MLRNEHRVEINRSPEDVFAYVADLCNEPNYVPNVLETEKISDGPCAVGSKYREVTRVMFGRKAVATYEITQYDPPQTFAFRGTSGRSKFRGRWNIEATDDGTLAKFTAEAKLAWPMKYMERVIRGSVAATFAVMTRNLKRALQEPAEQKAAAGAAARGDQRGPSVAKSTTPKPATGKRQSGARGTSATQPARAAQPASGAPSATQTPAKSPAQGRTRSGASGQQSTSKPAAKRSSRSRKPGTTRNQKGGGTTTDGARGGPSDPSNTPGA
jgi:hypothetical protein